MSWGPVHCCVLSPPCQVLANKVDIAKIERDALVKALNLDYITDNPWTVMSVSATRGDGIEAAVDFLIRHSK